MRNKVDNRGEEKEERKMAEKNVAMVEMDKSKSESWRKHYPCGCKIVGNGTGKEPFEIERCAKHDAAPDLLKALETTKHAIIRFHVSHGYCSDCKCARSDGHLDTCSLTVVRAAIDQAKGE